MNINTNTYIQSTIHDVIELVECRRIDEEGRDKVNCILALQIRVLNKLGLPPVCSCPLTKLTIFASEGGSENATLVFELVGMGSELGDVVTESLSICGRTAGENATMREALVKQIRSKALQVR